VRTTFADQLIGKLTLKNAANNVLLFGLLQCIVQLVHQIVEELVSIHLHTRVNGLAIHPEGLAETPWHV
jgi:hypothetical protein